KTNTYAAAALPGTRASQRSSLRTGRVLASMYPSRRIRHIWVMKASRPARPSPQPLTTSTGLVLVRVMARMATISVRTIANVSADGTHRSRNLFTGRITLRLWGDVPVVDIAETPLFRPVDNISFAGRAHCRRTASTARLDA